MAHSRPISILACCSLGWLAYSCYIHNRWSFRQSLEAVIKRNRKPSFIRLPAQPDLENLSTDVLLEIMGLLEWDDILRLRQVSTRLNVATRHRTIWYNLLKPSPARFTLQKRFDNCSSEDLEASYLRMQLAHRRWVKPSVPRRVELFADQDFPRRCPTTLLPGGRWLLMLTKHRELLYLDMDTPADAWRSLVPPSMDDDALRRCLRKCARLDYVKSLAPLIDMDVDAEYLTFNIVITSMYDSGGQQDFWPTRFTIWRVTTDFDDNGCATGLKATSLSVFEESSVCLDWDHIHLSGDFVAYHDDFPMVVNWRTANGCSDLLLPRYFIPTLCPLASFLYILPKKQVIFGGGNYDDWVVVGWGDLVPITRIPPWSEIEPIQLTVAQASISESDHLNADLSSREDHPPFIIGNYVSFISDVVYGGNNSIIRLSFKLPDPATPAPFFVKEEVLYTHPEWRSFTVTPTCALVQNRPGYTITTAINHISQDGSVSTLDTFSWDGVFPCDFRHVTRFMIDEISRRCIFGCHHGHYVIEF